MHNVELLMNALEFMEVHLKEDIKTEDIARSCYCSKSTLEKVFRCVNHISVHDYLIRRRMMLAARKIIEHPEKAIITIALEYGYSTHESFTRAFKNVWNCKPSAFPKTRFTELYPKLSVPLVNGDAYMKERKIVDITQLYDLFVSRKECYFICCDIKALVPINNISHKAGDLAIIETMNRMNEAAGAEDIVFRIGGDEFCILTSSKEAIYAEKIAERIRKHNGESFSFENQQIPLSLYVMTTKFAGPRLNYDELFTQLHMTIKEGK